jgi:hypothetical protein
MSKSEKTQKEIIINYLRRVGPSYTRDIRKYIGSPPPDRFQTDLRQMEKSGIIKQCLIRAGKPWKKWELVKS